MVYICPGGNCTGIAIFFFDKVSHLKHPNIHKSHKISITLTCSLTKCWRLSSSILQFCDRNQSRQLGKWSNCFVFEAKPTTVVCYGQNVRGLVNSDQFQKVQAGYFLDSDWSAFVFLDFDWSAIICRPCSCTKGAQPKQSKSSVGTPNLMESWDFFSFNSTNWIRSMGWDGKSLAALRWRPLILLKGTQKVEVGLPARQTNRTFYLYKTNIEMETDYQNSINQAHSPLSLSPFSPLLLFLFFCATFLPVLPKSS